jgi:hypothetical protein
MRYELYIRPAETDGTLAAEAVRAQLEAAGFTVEDGLRAGYALEDGRLEAAPFVRQPNRAAAEALDGLDLSFPMGCSAVAAEQAVALVFSLARALDAVIYDPQLAAVVQTSEQGRVIQGWRRSIAFQADVVGSSDLAGYGLSDRQSRRSGLLEGRTGWLVLLILFLLGVIWWFRSCDATAAGGMSNPKSPEGLRSHGS